MIRHVLDLKNVLLILSVVLLTYGLVGIGYTHTDTGHEHFHIDTETLNIDENKRRGTTIGEAFTVHETGVNTSYILRAATEDSDDTEHFRIDSSSIDAQSWWRRPVLTMKHNLPIRWHSSSEDNWTPEPKLYPTARKTESLLQSTLTT